MNNYDWDAVFNVNVHPQTVWENFSCILTYCIHTFAHNVRVRIKNKKKQVSPTLRRLFSLKASLWRILKNMDHTSYNYTVSSNHYKAVSLRIKKLLLFLRKSEEQKIIYSANPKRFFLLLILSLTMLPVLPFSRMIKGLYT